MPTPPRPAQRPFAITRHGDTRTDPYYWLMGREDEEVLTHLRAENAYAAEMLAPQQGLRDDLFAEFKAHIEETDISLPTRRGKYWHYARTVEGLSYPIICRLPVDGDDRTPPIIDPATPYPGEQIVLDENLEAEGHDFLSVGVFSISPDDRWVAVGVDFDGNELHHVTFRPLDGQEGCDDELIDVSYGFTWSEDSRYCFYTRVDDALRPFQIWRHEFGTHTSADVLVHQEDDAEFNVSVGRSFDRQVMYLAMSSSRTTEVRVLDAATPTGEFRTICNRVPGREVDLEHYSRPNRARWWIQTTNDEAKDFRALVRPVAGGEWRELIPQRAGVRLETVVAFQNFFVVIERFEGCPSLRIVPALDGDDPFGDDFLERSSLIDPGQYPASVFLSSNGDYDTPLLRVQMMSMVTPRLVADVDVVTGERIVRKQQTVKGGYDESGYITGRLWVAASDGVEIPVTVVARSGVLVRNDDGTLRAPQTAPLILNGYGSYESSTDPYFSAIRLSVLDRGVIFAVAHVRGGGEMGRAWYEMGRLDQKATTFSDFVAVARHLIDAGWTTPPQLGARGGSAGGLLMGAVMNLAPELFSCIVAEVPFVDALTTMLDASLPLTVGEWEEWGNPDASAATYRIMKGYSPYDNVSGTNPDGSVRRYPKLFATGGLNDSRVGFWEPAKWVAKIRDVNPQNVAIADFTLDAGHGGPSGRYDSWRDEAKSLAFLLTEIGAA